MNSGPTPPYSNLPIEPENYKPRKFDISNILLGRYTTVITDLPMNYVIGNQCRLWIPRLQGCGQINMSQSYVIAIPDAVTVILDLDSQQCDPFIQADFPNKPQIIAIGDVNSGNTAYPADFSNISVSGAFINISGEN